MNWGGFAGGFSQGFNNGVQMGKTVGDVIKQKKIDDIRAQGMAEAEAARNDEASKMVRESSSGVQPVSAAPAPQPNAPQTGQPAPDNDVAQTVAVPQPGAPMTPQDGQPPMATTPATAPTPTTPAAQKPELVAPPQAAQAAPTAPPPAAAGISGAPKPFMVGDQGFDTRDEALAHAKKNTPSVTDFFMKNAVPRISQAYLEQGDVAKAEAWDKYAKDKTTQKNMETWAKMERAATMGDFQKAGDHMFDLYKQYDDGVTPLSKEVVKDKDGKFTGFNVRLKNDETGEVTAQFIPQAQMVEMGLAALSPPAMFEQTFKRQQAADQLRAKAAIDGANDARTMARDREKAAATAAENEKKRANDLKLQGMKGDQRLEQIAVEEQIKSANVGAGEKKKIAAKVDALRGAGYNDEQLNGMMPALVGAGDYKKRTSPEEARRMLLTERVKDPLFNRESPEKQQQIIDQDMLTIYGKPGAGRGMPAAAPAATPQAAPTPRAGGAAAASANPAKKGVPVFDSKTGTIVYR